MIKQGTILALLALAMPLAAQTASPDTMLAATVAQHLAQGPKGARYGLLVTDGDGREIVAIAPDQRFIPGSNTKIFTTVAAYTELPALDRAARGAGVRLEQVGGRTDVVLVGHGDARLSSADDCASDCLATLADAVAAKTRQVRDVIGDDRWFPDERWSRGMSWDNLQTVSGTGLSALTLDDNAVSVTVTPAAVGAPPGLAANGYYTLVNAAVTVPGKEQHLDALRLPGSRTIRLGGVIGDGVQPVRLTFGIDDPAHYAAWRLRALLEARGVTVSGAVVVRHRPLTPADDPARRGAAPVVQSSEPAMLAELPALPLAQDVRIINKQSQNLHAELLLRRVARLDGSGSVADGDAVRRRVLVDAGVAEGSVVLADGSGMSSYNRITPRATVTLLRWAARQPWGMDWRATLPVGGQDGTLRNRFHGTALEGRLFAKTGSLNASRALSGYLVAKSGRTLIFSALVNDIPPGGDDAASAAVDRALLAIADAE